MSFTASWSLPSLSGFWEPDPAVVTVTWGDQEVLEGGSWKGEGSGVNVQALAFQGAVLVGQGRGEPGVAACWGKVPGKRRTQAGSSWKLACSILNRDQRGCRAVEGSTGATGHVGTRQAFLHFLPCRVSGPPSRTVVKFRRIHMAPRWHPQAEGMQWQGW